MDVTAVSFSPRFMRRDDGALAALSIFTPLLCSIRLPSYMRRLPGRYATGTAVIPFTDEGYNSESTPGIVFNGLRMYCVDL